MVLRYLFPVGIGDAGDEIMAIMSEADDYLDDSFLIDTPSSAPKTYAQRRKEAQKLSRVKNDQNKTKGRRQREIELRQEGLSKSLFARAKEEEENTTGNSNKALSVMMKMGFKPGDSLGADGTDSTPHGEAHDASTSTEQPLSEPLRSKRSEPLKVLEWEGKTGIGARKRPPSPGAFERHAKMAKKQESANHEAFRDDARQEYEERRAEKRLQAMRTTCATLDEKAGKSFNVLSLDPRDPDSFPDGLWDAMSEHAGANYVLLSDGDGTQRIESRLRRQMKADALLPLRADISETDDKVVSEIPCDYNSETLDEVLQFLQLNARDRSQLLLRYLRKDYFYCFWCGAQYQTEAEMGDLCPGEEEEAHD